MQRYGYFADLRGVQLSDSDKPKSWIMAMREGEYNHPLYGKISFTSDRLMRFAESVRQKIRGIDLDIDYDHKADPVRGNEAAGWVQDAKVENGALHLLVEWTSTAAQKIKEGAYRYFSPDYRDEWTDAKGAVHQDVLFGGGITNRPFLKDLLPVNLSELTFAEPKKEGTRMDPLKELRKLYGLPEDGSQDDQIVTRAESDRSTATNPQGQVDRTATTFAPNNAASDKQDKIDGLPYDATTAGSVDADGNARTPDEIELSELAKKNPLMARMLSEMRATNKRLAELEADNARQSVNIKLAEFRTGPRVVPPAMLDEAAKALLLAPKQLHESIYSMLRTAQQSGIQMGEVGYGTSGSGVPNGESATDRVNKLMATTRKQLSESTGKTDVTDYDVMDKIFSDDPQLYAEYREESYLFKK